MAHEVRMSSGLQIRLAHALTRWTTERLTQAVADHNLIASKGTAWESGDPTHKGFRSLDTGLAKFREDQRQELRKMVASGWDKDAAWAPAHARARGQMIRRAITCVLEVGLSSVEGDEFWITQDGGVTVSVDAPPEVTREERIARATNRHQMEF